MASIKKRNNKYAVRYDYTDEYGKRRQKWEEFNKKSEAEKFRAEVELKKLSNDFINPSVITVREFLNDWLKVYAQSNWQYKTYLNAQTMLNNHIIPAIGDKYIQKITPRDIEKFINELKFKKVSGSKSYNKSESEIPYLSSTTVGHVYTILKTAFDTAVEWRIISSNPVICKKPQRAKVETIIWDVDDVKTALNDIEHEQLHLAVHIAFVCSLRIGEILALTWDSIDFDNSCIYVQKTLQRVSKDAVSTLPNDKQTLIIPPKIATSKSVIVLKSPKTSSSRRVVYITNELRDELKKRKVNQCYSENHFDYNLVFSSEDGYPVESKVCEDWFRKWQEQTSCTVPKIIFHELRHSSTTYKLS